MNRYGYYSAAILLHLVALAIFALRASQVPSAAVEEEQYVLVTLAMVAPPPASDPELLLTPTPDATVTDPGIVDDAPRSSAAPGPLVDDIPPPVSVISPDVSSPPPSPEEPAPDSPASFAPPTLPTPTAAAAPVQPVGPPTPNVNPSPTTGVGRGPSSAPVSGRGRGGGNGTGRGGRGNGDSLGGMVAMEPLAGPSGHYYMAVYTPNGITWNNAQKYALVHGGYLATITSKEENNFVFSLINDAKFWKRMPQGENTGPWLGGFKDQSGRWQWVNNEGPLGFQNWAPREPDNTGGNQVWLCYYTWKAPQMAPTWDDTFATLQLNGFIIEFDHEPGENADN